MELKGEESAYEKPHIAEGLHPAEFVDLVEGPPGQYGDRVIAEFLVYHSEDEEPVKIGRFFGAKMSPKSKLWAAMEAIGAKPKVGESIDSDECKGSPCRVMVEDYDDDDGKKCSGITKVKEPSDAHQVAELVKRGLDLGEAEAIALAHEVSAELLLIDERKGAGIADEMGSLLMQPKTLSGIKARAEQAGNQ